MQESLPRSCFREAKSSVNQRQTNGIGHSMGAQLVDKPPAFVAEWTCRPYCGRAL